MPKTHAFHEAISLERTNRNPDVLPSDFREFLVGPTEKSKRRLAFARSVDTGLGDCLNTVAAIEFAQSSWKSTLSGTDLANIASLSTFPELTALTIHSGLYRISHVGMLPVMGYPEITGILYSFW